VLVKLFDFKTKMFDLTTGKQGKQGKHLSLLQFDAIFCFDAFVHE